MIRGRKNFLPANQLIAGFGIMFKVHSSCTARHVGERRIRGFGDDASQFEDGAASDEFSENGSENGGSQDETEGAEAGAVWFLLHQMQSQRCPVVLAPSAALMRFPLVGAVVPHLLYLKIRCVLLWCPELPVGRPYHCFDCLRLW